MALDQRLLGDPRLPRGQGPAVLPRSTTRCCTTPGCSARYEIRDGIPVMLDRGGRPRSTTPSTTGCSALVQDRQDRRRRSTTRARDRVAAGFDMTNALRSAPVRGSRRVLRVAARAATATALVVSATVVGFAVSVRRRRPARRRARERHDRCRRRVPPADPDPHLRHPRPGPRRRAALGRKPIRRRAATRTFDVPIVCSASAAFRQQRRLRRRRRARRRGQRSPSPSARRRGGYLEAYRQGREPPGTVGSSTSGRADGRRQHRGAAPGLRRQADDQAGAGAAAARRDVVDRRLRLVLDERSATADTGARLEPVGPGRILDSREAPFGGHAARAGRAACSSCRSAASTRSTPASPTSSPNSSNVVGVRAQRHRRQRPCRAAPTRTSRCSQRRGRRHGARRRATSTCRVGQIKSNMVIVPISADGERLGLQPRRATTHVDRRRHRLLPARAGPDDARPDGSIPLVRAVPRVRHPRGGVRRPAAAGPATPRTGASPTSPTPSRSAASHVGAPARRRSAT